MALGGDSQASTALRSWGRIGRVAPQQRASPSNNVIGSLIGDLGSAFAILFVFTFLNVFLNRNGMLGAKSSTAYPLIYGLAVLALAVSASARDAIRRHFALLCLASAQLAIMAVLVVFKSINAIQTEIFHDRIQSVAIMGACLVLVSSERRQQRSLNLLAITVLGGCALNLLEFFHLLPQGLSFSYVAGRSAGLYANPNTSAFFIATALPLITVGRSAPMKLLMIAATLMGVFFTFSRGGLVTWLCAAGAVYVFGEQERRAQFVVLLRRAAPLLLIGGGVIAAYLSLQQIYQMLDPSLSAGAGARLQFAVDQNIRDRIGLAGAGWRAFTDHPLTGLGVGYTYQWAVGNDVHNLFLMIAAEYGLLGLIWFAAYLWSIRRYSTPPAYWLLVVLVVSSMFTHNHLDHTAFGVLTALYIATAARIRDGSNPDRRTQAASGAPAGRP